MSTIYRDSHRQFQDLFDSRRMADRLEEIIVREEITPEDQSFIEAQEMFFLATVDADGQPTVSFKGGAKGFAKVLDPKTLVFPSYDGNGMFYSVGNLAQTPSVGLLFIDFQTPNRMRVHGTASVDPADPLKASFPGADLIVRIAITKIWTNCPRYIPKMELVERSRYIPDDAGAAPVASWKRIDIIQDALPARDQGVTAQEGGEITADEWLESVAKGES